MKIRKGIPVIDQHDKNYMYGRKFGGNFIPETLKKPVEDLTILFEKLKKEISSFKPKKTNQDWSKEIKDLLIKPINFLYTYDFPHGPPEEKENIEFMQLINKDFKKSFLKSRIYMWVIESLRNSDKNEYTSFGWFSKKAHDSIINIPPPKRRDVKRLLENLFKWIVKYSDDIEIITHNKSEELKLK